MTTTPIGHERVLAGEGSTDGIKEGIGEGTGGEEVELWEVKASMPPTSAMRDEIRFGGLRILLFAIDDDEGGDDGDDEGEDDAEVQQSAVLSGYILYTSHFFFLRFCFRLLTNASTDFVLAFNFLVFVFICDDELCDIFRDFGRFSTFLLICSLFGALRF